MKRIVLTAIGQDRPGIVASVTEILYKNNCNIEDSTMSILEGEFAMILIFKAPKDSSAQKLESAFAGVGEKLKLHVHLKEIEVPKVKTSELSAERQVHMISLLGADQPGLVFRVTQLLARHKVNITDLNTKQMGSAEKPTYAMLIEVELPPTAELQTLKKELAGLEKELGAEITIKPIDILQL